MPCLSFRIAAVLLAATACSAPATIKTSGQPAIEGRIVGGDGQALYVQNGSNEVYRLPKNRVLDIDHPGNLVFTIGAIGFGSAVPLALSRPLDRLDSDLAAQLLIFAGIAALGGWQWWLSSSAVEAVLPAGTEVNEFMPLQEVR